MKSAARTKNEMRKKSESEERGQRSICPSCENFSQCGFRNHSSDPVFYCEEFTSGFSRAMPAAPEKGPGGKAPLHDREKLIGLCANCDNADACLYPKYEAGIWHCEEYR
ncbi:MAG: hypothetical protein PHU03_08740 [Syntrophales bacterium]|nr:hypothetical protein [Syntrophales bacterium]